MWQRMLQLGSGGTPTSNHIIKANVIFAEAYVNNFDSNSTNWGGITQNGGVYNTTYNAVNIDTSTNLNNFASYDLGANNVPCIIYAVFRTMNSGTYLRTISAMNDSSAGKGSYIFASGHNLSLSNWGGSADISIELNDSSNFVAVAMRVTPTISYLYTPTNSYSINHTITDRYIYAGRTRSDNSVSTASNMMIRYLAITTNEESNTEIQENLSKIYSRFI